MAAPDGAPLRRREPPPLPKRRTDAKPPPHIANPIARSAPKGAFGADAHIGSMAREDFLGCLSKAWIEKVRSSLRVLLRPRAKDTRAEVIDQAFSELPDTRALLYENEAGHGPC